MKKNNASLKPLSHEDIFACIAQFSPMVQHALHVESAQAEQDYLEALVAQQKISNTYAWVIVFGSTIVGLVVIRDRITHANQGQLYSWLNESYWGRRIYQSALEQASESYFAQTGDVFYTAHVDCDNMRSYKALKKAGFADYALSDGAHGKQFELILRNKKRP